MRTLTARQDLRQTAMKKYVDSAGTIIVTNSSAGSSGGYENAVSDETSNFLRKPRPISAVEKARITALTKARQTVGILEKAATGHDDKDLRQ